MTPFLQATDTVIMAGSRAIDKLRVQGCATTRFTPQKEQPNNFGGRPKGYQVASELNDSKLVINGLTPAVSGKENIAAAKQTPDVNYFQRSASARVKRDDATVLCENIFLIRGKTLLSEDFNSSSKSRTVGRMGKSESCEAAPHLVDTNDRLSYVYLREYPENFQQLEESMYNDVGIDSGRSVITHSSAGSVTSNNIVFSQVKPVNELLEAKMATPLSLQRDSKMRRSYHSTSALALTGLKLQLTRDPDVDFQLHEDTDSLSAHWVDPVVFDQQPHSSPASTARRRMRPQKTNLPSEVKMSSTEPNLLQRCLRVQMPHQSESDPAKIRPLTYVEKKADDTRNSPSSLRATKPRDEVLTQLERYRFNSVDSYINFRSVQSQVSVKNQDESKPFTRSASFKLLTRIQPDGSFAAVTDRMLRSSFNNKFSELRAAVPRNKFIKDESDSMLVVGVASIKKPPMKFATTAKSNRSIAPGHSWVQVKQAKTKELLTPKDASIVPNKGELEPTGSSDIKGREFEDNNTRMFNDALDHSREASRVGAIESLKDDVRGTKSESYLDSMNKADHLLQVDVESIESPKQKDNSVHSGSIRSFPSDADNELTDSYVTGSGIDV